jgi:hypothetical protein
MGWDGFRLKVIFPGDAALPPQRVTESGGDRFPTFRKNLFCEIQNKMEGTVYLVKFHF